MKKIGILTCLNSNDVCTRAGCLSAFRERRDFFSGYPEDTILAAVMTCNGCKETNAKEPAEDEGILEKADRLVSEKISVIHVGVCRLNEEKKECPRITQICGLIEERGIKVIRGTHKESEKTAVSFRKCRKYGDFLCDSKNKPPAMQGEGRSLDISNLLC